jgi:thiamine-phosphate pyrophosphorylase
MVNRAERLAGAHLYLVCGEHPDSFLEAALRGGVDIVQLRIKDATDEHLVATGRRYAEVCAAHGALFVVNDRPDLVAEVDADGVHVGQDDMAVASARAIVGPDLLIGLSTHSPEQVDAAGRVDVDYIGVGPVHETPTKPGRPAVGLELVRYAAAAGARPFFAIGGIDVGNVGAVAGAGAKRVAVVRALTQSLDPEGTARALRGALVARAGLSAPVGRAGPGAPVAHAGPGAPVGRAGPGAPVAHAGRGAPAGRAGEAGVGSA